MKTGALIALAAAAVLSGSAVAAWAETLQLPGGSYRVTCNDARAWRGQGGDKVLTARCRMANGAWRQTSLRYGGCRGDIANINGNLTCKTSAAPGYGGGGPAAASLTLYSQAGYHGASVTLRGPTPSLAPWSFGDKTKSLQVRGRGRWQVCTLINYGGRCEIVGDSIYDLGSWRLSNQISSARPYR